MTQKRNFIKEQVQKLYLAFSTFMANDLLSYAAAGAYSFFLSALPIVLMVLVILVRFFNASPSMISDLLGSITVLSDTVNLDSLFASVLSIKSIGIFEIIIGVSIFWMARRFFMSIQRSMRNIYKKRGKAKPFKENLIVIAGEALLIIIITITIIIFIAARAFLATGFSQKILGYFIWNLARLILRFLPSFVLWIFLLMVFYIMPRTRPSFKMSLFTATGCTLSFVVTQFVFATFINMTRYNLVYGILSNVIVLLLEVFMFFILLLFFAQLQYVSQFFDSFLLGELYLLPEWHDPLLKKQLERLLFLDVPALNRRYLVSHGKGDILFTQSDISKEIYYIRKGQVLLTQQGSAIELGSGKIFGELSVLLGGNRISTAQCLTDCELLRLPESLFTETIEVNGDFSRRTLQAIADYIAKGN